MKTRAYTVAMFSGKGGVGKSFMAAHFGSVLAQQEQRTLLVDVDLQYGGSLANMFNITPSQPRSVFLHGDHQHTVFHVRPNLDLVCPPQRLEQAIRMQKQDISSCISFLQMHYDWIIMDLCHQLHFANVSALSSAHAVWLVTTNDWLARYKTQYVMQQLHTLGLSPGRMRVVVNALQRPLPNDDSTVPTYGVPYDAAFHLSRNGRMKLSEACMPYILDMLNNEVPAPDTGTRSLRNDLKEDNGYASRQSRVYA